MPVRPMRTLVPLALAAVALAPHAAAQGTYEHTIYLHENPLHALPETINANVGDTLKLAVENPSAEGKTPHNLVVCADAPSPSEQCTNVWARSVMIQPGASAPLSFVADQAGTFQYWCYIAGHKGGGMVGTLVVQGADQDEKGTPALGPAGLALALAFALALVRGRLA